ncbi:hypothetical protein TVAG_172090 [Trichomonas vaginalis G3]|uniref:WD repeat protein n=1 Tax=Trichomonas vaginalis (strain ATCC PRA-98 / G3) TaxID=412133 RepID=A2DEW0_TRIV3|nr:cilia- and flagella-associated protein 57 family [Trichomonas vaginalis G3]EAY20952.1 hypothetical protein TVAG_172090 [Trichomonas vaginalis G3]KAI5519111.1 cilia- and flagella-associated protein 57 family [Trichomonas vaginalis G3]|eukprot:XP_001581938.1 hypothetical protein [Trichomonas vaginalis G3]
MTSYTGLRLEPVSALGVNFLENGTVHWNSSSQFFYPVGMHITQYHTETGSQQFLFPERFTSACAEVIKLCDVAVTSNGQFIAISEVFRPNNGILSIYDTETQVAHVHLRHGKIAKFLSLTFSTDASLIAALGIGDGENRVFVWKMGRQVSLAAIIPIDNNVKLIQFDPADASRLLLFSEESVSICLINTIDKQLKKIETPGFTKYDRFCFVPGIPGLLLLVSDNKILTIMSDQYVNTIEPPSKNISFIRTIRNNVFVIDNNMIYYYKATGGEPHLIYFGPLDLSINSISEISPSPDGDLAVVIYDDSYTGILHLDKAFEKIKQAMEAEQSEKLQLDNEQEDELNEFMKTQSSIDVSETNAVIGAAEMNQFNGLFTPLPIRCHMGPIVAIATCPRKPLLATCGGQDRTLLVWNLAKRTVIASEKLREPVNSCSFHPSGDLLAVGTSDKLLLYSLTFDSLVLRAKWDSLSCTCVSFSNGGHLLAAGALIIKVISTYSAKTVTSLRGHNSSVKSITWAPNDSFFVSSGLDGNVFQWNARMWERNLVVSLQSQCIGALLAQSQTASDNSNSTQFNILVATNNNTIYDETTKTERSPTRHLNFTAFCMPVNLSIISGDVRGNLQVIPFPLLPMGEENPFNIGIEVAVHTGPVHCIMASSDGQTLFTASEDSSIFIFNVVQPHQMVIAAPVSLALSREEQSFLIEREQFEDKKENLTRLREMLNLHRSQFQCAKTKLIETQSREIAQQKNKWQMTVCSLKKQVHALQNQKAEQEKKAADIIAESDTQHFMKIKSVKELYEQKLTEQTKHAAELMKEKIKIQCEYEEKLHFMTEEFKAKLQERRDTAEKQLKVQSLDNDEAKKRLLQCKSLHPKEEQLLREEHEKDMEILRKEYAEELNKIQQSIEGIRTKLVGNQDDYDSKLESKATINQQINKLTQENAAMKRRNEKMKADTEAIDRDLQARSERVARQTNHLRDLQSQNEELLKWRNVTDSQLNEMKKQALPKKQEIETLKQMITANEATLRAQKLSDAKDDEELEKMEAEINGLYDEILKTDNAAQKCTSKINQFKNRVHTIYTEIPEAKWADEVQLLNEQFGTEKKLEREDHALLETLDEFERHKSALAEKVVELRVKVEEDSEANGSKFMKQIGKNEEIIAELARLRKENNDLKSKLHLAQINLNSLMRQCRHESKPLETKVRPLLKSTNIIQPTTTVQKKMTYAGATMTIDHFT